MAMKNRTLSTAGTSLLEVLVAGVILTITLTSLYALYGQSVRNSRDAAECAAADRYLVTQMEQLRCCGWATLTGTGGLPSIILSRPTDPVFAGFPDSGITRTLGVYVSPSTSGTASSLTSCYSVTQTGDASTRVVTNGSVANISSQRSLLFDLSLQWTARGHTFTRKSTAIIAQALQ